MMVSKTRNTEVFLQCENKRKQNTVTQVKVVWVVMPCSFVVGYQCFRGLCCFHLQSEVPRMGKDGTDTGPNWRGVAGAASQ